LEADFRLADAFLSSETSKKAKRAEDDRTNRRPK
jgi:hypothetical protein